MASKRSSKAATASKRSSKAATTSKRSSKQSDTADEVRGHLRAWAEEVKLTPNDDTVSLETVADSGGIPMKRVQQWIGEGKLPPCRGGEGRQYWSALDLLQWWEAAYLHRGTAQ